MNDGPLLRPEITIMTCNRSRNPLKKIVLRRSDLGLALGLSGELVEVFAGCGDHQSPVLHSPEAEDTVRQVLEVGPASLHDDHFQAIVMVAVYVCGGQHVVGFSGTGKGPV